MKQKPSVNSGGFFRLTPLIFPLWKISYPSPGGGVGSIHLFGNIAGVRRLRIYKILRRELRKHPCNKPDINLFGPMIRHDESRCTNNT